MSKLCCIVSYFPFEVLYKFYERCALPLQLIINGSSSDSWRLSLTTPKNAYICALVSTEHLNIMFLCKHLFFKGHTFLFLQLYFYIIICNQVVSCICFHVLPLIVIVIVIITILISIIIIAVIPGVICISNCLVPVVIFIYQYPYLYSC